MRLDFLIRHSRRGTLIGLLVLCGGLALASPFFLTWSNLLNIAEQTTVNGIIAAGMTFVIISAGIDLSVGSILAFAGVAMASALAAGYSPWLAVPIALLVGFACGAVNGGLISFGKLPPFIATLGMMSMARGAALVFTNGRPISGFGEGGFRSLATGEIATLPSPVLLLLLLFCLCHLVLTRTRFGRYTFAMGGNEEAARLSGINVRFHKVMVYGLSGALSGLAAVVLTARLNSAQPNAGIMYELDAIAATVIGGTSLTGGEGSMGGTLIGALIMGVLRNGLNLLGVSSYLQQLVVGVVIVVAVLIDSLTRRLR